LELLPSPRKQTRTHSEMASHFPYRTRRTVKPHQMEATKEVDAAVLREVLEDAIWAPTHGLTQPWRFHVFVGGSRGRLAGALESIYDRITAPSERRDDKRAKLRTNVITAPVTVAVAARIEPGGRISELDEIAATSCAVQNILLSAHQRGLGSFWSTAPVSCSAHFAQWLGLEPECRCMGLVYLGYPLVGAVFPSSRLPLAERVVFHDSP
jgi:nitroreductase